MGRVITENTTIFRECSSWNIVGNRGIFRYIPRCSSRSRSGVLHYIPRPPFVGNRGIFHYIPRQRSRGIYYRFGIYRYIPRRILAEHSGVAEYYIIFRDGRLGKLPVSRDIPLYSATERLVRKTKNPARRVRRAGVTPTNYYARARPSVNRPRASGGVFGQTIPTLPRVILPYGGAFAIVMAFGLLSDWL